MAQLNFDANSVAPSTGQADAIPAGWYNAAIDESGMKPVKDNPNHSYLQLRFTILDGEYANRKVFTRLNLRNSNPVTQEIAYGDLSAICHAVGVLQLQMSEQLHGLPMKIKVKLSPATEQYEASNDIKAFKNINEQVGGPAGAAPAGQAAPQQQQPPQGWGGAPQQQQPAQQQPPAQQQQPAPQQAPANGGWQPPPQQQAAPAPQQAPAQQQPGGWQQPAGGQPWGQPGGEQAAPQQQPAPAQQPAPQQQEAPQQQHPAQSAPPPWQPPQQ